MPCPDCDAEQVRLDVPTELRVYAPEREAAVAICTRCLRVEPVEGDTAPAGEPHEISDSLPAEEATAVALLLAVEKLSSVTLNREAIEGLVAHAEREGVDYRLALERLAADPDLDPGVDVARRLQQFEQLS